MANLPKNPKDFNKSFWNDVLGRPTLSLNTHTNSIIGMLIKAI